LYNDKEKIQGESFSLITLKYNFTYLKNYLILKTRNVKTHNVIQYLYYNKYYILLNWPLHHVFSLRLDKHIIQLVFNIIITLLYYQVLVNNSAHKSYNFNNILDIFSKLYILTYLRT